MGAGRSLVLLYKQYKKQKSRKNNLPPTKSKYTIEQWSFKHRWDERAKAADKEDEESKLAAIKEETKREHIERIRAFRKAADQSVITSMVTSASTLKGVQAIAEKVVARIQLEAETNLKDLMTVAQVLDMLTKNTNQGFDLKAKIEGLEAVLDAMEK